MLIYFYITEGAPRENLSSKGSMKLKIFEMIAVHKKDGSTLVKILYRPMLGFGDSKKVGGILNEYFL